MFGLKIVENWKSAWRWISVWCMSLSAAIMSSWDMLPPEWKAALPSQSMGKYVVPLLIIGIVGRFIDQTTKLPE